MFFMSVNVLHVVFQADCAFVFQFAYTISVHASWWLFLICNCLQTPCRWSSCPTILTSVPWGTNTILVADATGGSLH
jgi:hypothetical protein